MRWYRQDACELIRDEPSDLVALADEEVVDATHDGDARVRHGRGELRRRAEPIVLGRDDERARRDRRQRPRREGHVLRPDADERDGLRRAAAVQVFEDLERPEAVADEAERQTRSEAARLADRGGEIFNLVLAAAPGAGARADAAEVEAQR